MKKTVFILVIVSAVASFMAFGLSQYESLANIKLSFCAIMAVMLLLFTALQGFNNALPPFQTDSTISGSTTLVGARYKQKHGIPGLLQGRGFDHRLRRV